ncbi:hypothetical protein B0H17DRAFT_1184378 [Mycena rosella]|uniref:Uncharacterized protein n=1 Tax=Mycena rosella TaxID=1033263 RepID=A0AAD7CVT9_MYCRO|nr:hypothetical protein B0H17DRAFT_1184378 [Mycena rosella]
MVHKKPDLALPRRVVHVQSGLDVTTVDGSDANGAEGGQDAGPLKRRQAGAVETGALDDDGSGDNCRGTKIAPGEASATKETGKKEREDVVLAMIRRLHAGRPQTSTKVEAMKPVVLLSEEKPHGNPLWACSTDPCLSVGRMWQGGAREEVKNAGGRT